MPWPLRARRVGRLCRAAARPTRPGALTTLRRRSQELDEESLRDNFVIGASAATLAPSVRCAGLTAPALAQCMSCSTR